jgi:peptidoglycan-N-acetylglucosamine deacetylase
VNFTPQRIRDAVARRLFGTVVSVRTAENVAALTFDDGPDPESTPRFLDLLRRHGAKATFFMIGAQAARHPALVARLAAEGHEIGNHSWDHPALPLLDRRGRETQLARARAALAPHGQALMRPPYGYQTLASHLSARRQGYRVVCWNSHCEDWACDDSEILAGRLLESVRPGTILLLHDTLETYLEERLRDRTPLLEALDRLLTERSDFRFVTVSDLLRRGKPMTRYWISRPDPAFLGALQSRQAPTP